LFYPQPKTPRDPRDSSAARKLGPILENFRLIPARHEQLSIPRLLIDLNKPSSSAEARWIRALPHHELCSFAARV